MKALRPYQTAGVERFLASKRKRLIWAWATGAGKTGAGLEVAKRLKVNSLLIIGSAQSRGTWTEEIDAWWPERAGALRSVRWGKENKSLTKKDFLARDEAYASRFQVVSYSLLGHLSAARRDLVIIDEGHALKNPMSEQSQVVREFVHTYPDMPTLLFTATPVPNEVQDIWNPVDTLVKGYLGKATDTGGVSWDFKRRYCQVKEGWEGRKVFYGAKSEALPELAKRLESVMHRVSSKEVALYAPKLNASILWIDDPKRQDTSIAMDWLESRGEDGSTHIGMFSWTHDTAHKLGMEASKAGWEVVTITGTMSPEDRRSTLVRCSEMEKVCVVGTAGSLAESVSLSFIKQALVFEWRTTPGQALQFAGRFARQDSVSKDPTYLLYVARTDDAKDAKVLRGRLDTVAQLYEQDTRATELQELMAPRALTEERLSQLAANMFSEVRLSFGTKQEDDDE